MIKDKEKDIEKEKDDEKDIEKEKEKDIEKETKLFLSFINYWLNGNTEYISQNWHKIITCYKNGYY